ncbi:MAG TPA: MerR family transcriptional regulator [Leptolyngbyaceae cyanobacterium]
MSTLQQISQGNPQWSLEEFVEVANELLPQFLPPEELDSRVQDTINPRLVRYYTTQGLLDKPLKLGREARYVYRHLLQLLVLRRLLAKGYNAGSLGNVMVNKPERELEALLLGEAQLTVEAARPDEAANPALAFLSRVRQRSLSQPPIPPSPRLSAPASPPPAAPASPPPPSAPNFTTLGTAPSAPAPAQWVRLDLLPGVELHIREDLYPTDPEEHAELVQRIAQGLAEITLIRRQPP